MTEFDNDITSADEATAGAPETAVEDRATDDVGHADGRQLPDLTVEDEVYGVTAEEKYNEAAEDRPTKPGSRPRPATEAGDWTADEPADEDPIETLRPNCGGRPGDWYVVHSYAGYENKVKTNLESRISSLDMEDYIYQVEVPTEEVTEIKNGKRQQVNRKVFPGYILVRMDLTDDSWGAVRNTPGRDRLRRSHVQAVSAVDGRGHQDPGPGPDQGRRGRQGRGRRHRSDRNKRAGRGR